MASHTVSALWERWFNYCKGNHSSATHVRHHTDSCLRGSLVKEICAHLSWDCSGTEYMRVGEFNCSEVEPLSRSELP